MPTVQTPPPAAPVTLDPFARQLDERTAARLESQVERLPVDWRARRGLLRALHTEEPTVRRVAARLLRRLVAGEAAEGPSSALQAHVRRVMETLQGIDHAHRTGWREADVAEAVERALAEVGLGQDPPRRTLAELERRIAREGARRSYAEMQRLVRRWPDGPELLALWLAANEMFGHDAVLAILVEWLARNPLDAERWAELARRCTRYGRGDEAIRAWERTLQLRPGDAEAEAALERLRRYGPPTPELDLGWDWTTAAGKSSRDMLRDPDIDLDAPAMERKILRTPEDEREARQIRERQQREALEDRKALDAEPPPAAPPAPMPAAPPAPMPAAAPRPRKKLEAAAPPTRRRALRGAGPPVKAEARPVEGFEALFEAPEIEADREDAAPPPPVPRARPWFERALGEDAGRPGPLERLTARSRLLLRSLQATIGLRFILIAGAADALVDATVGYVGQVWRVWRRGLSVRRMLARKASGEQRAALERDLAEVRRDLSRLLGLAGYRPEDGLEIADRHPSLRDEVDARPSFALELALRGRHRLDRMRDDLDLLSAQQIERLVRSGVLDVLKGMLPNPLEALRAWKDLLLLGLLMRYPRREVQRMYLDLVLGYRDLLVALDRSLGAAPVPLALAGHEDALRARLGETSDPPIREDQLNAAIDRCRHRLRRLTWLLASPGAMIDPRRWPRPCLLDEMDAALAAGAGPTAAALELETWLTRRLARRVPADLAERERRAAEARELRRRRRLQRRLAAWFV